MNDEKASGKIALAFFVARSRPVNVEFPVHRPEMAWRLGPNPQTVRRVLLTWAGAA